VGGELYLGSSYGFRSPFPPPQYPPLIIGWCWIDILTCTFFFTVMFIITLYSFKTLHEISRNDSQIRWYSMVMEIYLHVMFVFNLEASCA
jgi:hypothetical protein